jgi:PilZ domain
VKSGTGWPVRAACFMTLVILCNHPPKVQSVMGAKALSAAEYRRGEVLPMSADAKMTPKGSDWTRLLTDPDLVSHLGKLLQTYREVPAEERESALLRAMREIKDAAIKAREAKGVKNLPQQSSPIKTVGVQKQVPTPSVPEPVAILHHPEPVAETPPFELDPFAGQSESDRRRFQRIKCYVAVEIHIEGVQQPVWGNLANVGRGGCLVETAGPVPAGKALEIGLWVASGKIWVKGVIISGVATRSAPSFGVRVKFSQAELLEKEHLREFLKFVETTARQSQSGKAYVAQLKG